LGLPTPCRAQFTANAFGLSFLLLLLVNLAMMSFGFMVAAMLLKVSAGGGAVQAN
jgi:hypothetical protein